MTELRLAFVCDYAEEGWPSMDLIAAMLPAAVADVAGPSARIDRLQPAAKRRLQRLAGTRWPASIGDRLVSRYVDYPRWLRAHDGADRVYHVLDHSYAHLVRTLPAERTMVTCHDLDAFKCVIDPAGARRPWVLRRLVRRTLRGLKQAAKVACVSEAVRDELAEAGLVERKRLLVVPNGVHPAFTPAPDAAADAEATRLLGGDKGDAIELLHVGIPIPRKRIDRALAVLAALGRVRPGARLVRVGGPLTADLRARADRLGVSAHVVELPPLTPEVLAAVYRRATVLLMPSDAEGFGLPVIEALACGTPVVASHLRALRQTGGSAARYVMPDDVNSWCSEVWTAAGQSHEELERWRTGALSHAARFTWRAAAEALWPVYQELNAR